MKPSFKKTKLENHMLFAIADENGKPIAVALLNLKSAQIGALLVDSKHRNRGFATQLLEEIEKYAKKENFKTLQVVTHPTNDATRKLFKKRGYKEWIKLLKKF